MKYSLLALGFLALAACGENYQVNRDVDESIQANGLSSNHVEWESSQSHPQRVFARWELKKAKSENVCEALNKRSDEELTIFEEEIKQGYHKDLLEKCQGQLIDRLAKYWETQTTKATGSFKFKTETVVRDFSKGAYLVGGNLKPMQVQLTFDDGPHASYTQDILNTLESVGARVIFFAMGRNSRQHPELLRAEAKRGHEVGSHSFTHRCLGDRAICGRSSVNPGRNLTFDEAVSDIRAGHQAVYDALGWVSPYFRFPFGEHSRPLQKYLSDRGVGEFYWSVDSNDWRAQPVDHLIDTVVSTLKRQRGGILLMHDVQHRTQQALPRILKELYFEGFQLVIMRPADRASYTQSGLVNLRAGNGGGTLPVAPAASVKTAPPTWAPVVKPVAPAKAAPVVKPAAQASNKDLL